MKIRFFANLGEENARELATAAGSREAVLLSPNRAPNRVLQAAAAVKAAGIPLAADNGNTAVIFKVEDEFRAEAEGLLGEWKLAGGPDKPPAGDLKTRFRSLSYKIASRCESLATDALQKDILSGQAAVEPDFFMCLEDLTIPLLTILGIDPACTGRQRRSFVKMQSGSIRLAEEVLGGRLGAFHGLPYATLHGYDYESAFQAAGKAGTIAGLQGVATGLASFLNDREYVNGYRFKGRWVWIKNRQNIPRRYLRAMLVTLGMIDGFAAQRGAAPRFHALGAGSPILLPLLALCASGSPFFSADSTAPEKNASMGKIFVSVPAPLTLSVENIATALVEGRRSWDCPCPHCAELLAHLPIDLAAARQIYSAEIAPRKIELEDLKKPDGIGRHLSICWEANQTPEARRVHKARVNHNHWAIAEIIQGIRRHSQDYRTLREWVGNLCEAYQKATSPVFALQIDECLRLVERLRGG